MDVSRFHDALTPTPGIQPRWLLRSSVLLSTLGITLAVLLFDTDLLDGVEANLGAATLAILIVLITLVFDRWIIIRLGAAGLIHAIFLSMTALSFSVTSIVVMLADPNMSYWTMHSDFELLDSGWDVQFATFLFVCAYVAIAMAIATISPQPFVFDLSLKGPSYFSIVAVAIIANGLYLLEIVAPLSSASYFLVHLIRNALGPVAFVIGVLWARLGTLLRLTVLGSFLVFAAVNLVANSRGWAIMPIVMILVGVLASPEYRLTTKVRVMGTAALAFPWIMAIGNITRMQTGTIGFDNLGDRITVLQESLNGDGVATESGVLLDTVFRLFPTGGHSLISRTPGTQPFIGFDFAQFMNEAVHVLVPSFLLPYDRFSLEYAGTSILRNYGFIITESTSVPVSTVGSLYAINGLVSVIIGAVCVASLYGIASHLICLWSSRSILGAFVLAGSVSTALWAYNEDFISLASGLVTGWIVIITAFSLLSLLGRKDVNVRSRSRRRNPVFEGGER